MSKRTRECETTLLMSVSERQIVVGNQFKMRKYFSTPSVFSTARFITWRALLGVLYLACFTWRALLALSQFEDRKNGAVVRRDRFVKNFGFHHAPSIR